MPEKDKDKTAFVISPIGSEGSETRERSDQILKHIITPTVENFGYKTIRADKISEPGIITSQVIQHLLDADLVVADLTGHNPNVFYELAVRHVVRKPIVQMIETGDQIPFDVAPIRTIQVDHRNMDSVENCKALLTKQIQAVVENPANVDTPISIAIGLESLRQSGDPLKKSYAEILSKLQDVSSQIRELGGVVSKPSLDIELLVKLRNLSYRLTKWLTLKDDDEPTRSRFQEGRRMARKIHQAVSDLTRQYQYALRMLIPTNRLFAEGASTYVKLDDLAED